MNTQPPSPSCAPYLEAAGTGRPPPLPAAEPLRAGGTGAPLASLPPPFRGAVTPAERIGMAGRQGGGRRGGLGGIRRRCQPGCYLGAAPDRPSRRAAPLCMAPGSLPSGQGCGMHAAQRCLQGSPSRPPPPAALPCSAGGARLHAMRSVHPMPVAPACRAARVCTTTRQCAPC